MPGTALVALVLHVAATGATAQQVYRCGPEGREYSQTPCKDGRAVDTADPRSATQQHEAQAAAQSQRRLAQQLEAERHEREASTRKLGPAGIKPVAPPTAAPGASAPRKRGAKTKPTPATSNPLSAPVRAPLVPKEASP